MQGNRQNGEGGRGGGGAQFRALQQHGSVGDLRGSVSANPFANHLFLFKKGKDRERNVP